MAGFTIGVDIGDTFSDHVVEVEDGRLAVDEVPRTSRPSRSTSRGSSTRPDGTQR
jgi:hypothetical protein